MTSSTSLTQCNQFVLDNIIDESGSCDIDTCPNCNKEEAHIRHFESCITGSVNQHTEVNCKNCGYHYCDRDACDICESRILATPSGYDECANIDLLLDSIIDNLNNNKPIKTDWSFLKLYIHKNPSLISWYDMIFNDTNTTISTPSQLIWMLQSKLLDARFELRIRSKINQAHLEL